MPEETTVKISQIEPDGSGDAISDTELSPVAMSKKEPHIFRLLFKPKEWSATFTGSPQIVDLNRVRGDTMYPLVFSLYIQDAYSGTGAEPVDLTGLRVEFAYRLGSGEPKIITGSIYDAVNKVCFTPKEDDFSQIGNYIYDVQVVQAESGRITICTGKLVVTDDVNKT